MYADKDQWWNTGTKPAAPADVSADVRRFTYSLPQDTLGVLLCAAGADGKPRDAAGYAVPEMRVYGPDTWRQMDVEIEWGFAPERSALPYDGALSAYDGVIADVRPLPGDDGTTVEGRSFLSARKGAGRRGVQLSLLHMGTSAWRRMWPNAPTAADLPRTVVTVQTKSGGFSFLAADLENGPILAPEHGFFVRATKRIAPEAVATPPPPKPAARTPELLGTKLTKLLGAELNGWGTAATPFIVANAGNAPVTISKGFVFPPQAVAVHPSPSRDAAVVWRSPVGGRVAVQAKVASIHAGSGDGVAWSIVKQSGKSESVLAQGAVDSGGKQSSADPKEAKALADLPVEKGDTLILAVNRRGHHACDSTGVEFVVQEKGGQGRKWDLAGDVVANIQAGNPHADSLGNADAWSFCSIVSSEATVPAAPARHEPPFDMASDAASAAEFVRALEAKGLKTVRQRTREAAEQSWEGALRARFGEREFPPIPETKQMPAMRVSVPSERLTAQWNLGAWHILRTAGRAPKGEVRLADHPYAVLAQETFQMIYAWDGIAWDISMGAMDLMDPAKLLPLSDPRAQGHMDVLEDRLLLENRKVFMRSRDYEPNRDWPAAGWHHQCAYERNPQIHLDNDDAACFLRGMLNQYAAHIAPGPYTFNEHTTRGPADKPFEEAGFVERFRDMLVCEDGDSLWLARATPRAWLEQGKKIAVKDAPTYFGTAAYEIASDVDTGRINATVEVPSRKAPDRIALRFRHPKAAPIKSATVNGKDWKEFSKDKEAIELKGLAGKVTVTANY